MARKPVTGETRRAFLKHVKYGVVKAVEFDETGYALAATDINLVTACRHQIDDYDLTLDGVEDVNDHKRDWEPFEPECSDPSHLLGEIGKAELACQQAEAEYDRSKSETKQRKEVFDQHTEALRMLVRDATSPKKMPLFDGAAA
jgi:hypothetical protein